MTEADHVHAAVLTSLPVELEATLVVDLVKRELRSRDLLHLPCTTDGVEVLQRTIGVAVAILCLGAHQVGVGQTEERHVIVGTARLCGIHVGRIFHDADATLLRTVVERELRGIVQRVALAGEDDRAIGVMLHAVKESEVEACLGLHAVVGEARVGLVPLIVELRCGAEAIVQTGVRAKGLVVVEHIAHPTVAGDTSLNVVDEGEDALRLVEVGGIVGHEHCPVVVGKLILPTVDDLVAEGDGLLPAGSAILELRTRAGEHLPVQIELRQEHLCSSLRGMAVDHLSLLLDGRDDGEQVLLDLLNSLLSVEDRRVFREVGLGVVAIGHLAECVVEGEHQHRTDEDHLVHVLHDLIGLRQFAQREQCGVAGGDAGGGVTPDITDVRVRGLEVVEHQRLGVRTLPVGATGGDAELIGGELEVLEEDLPDVDICWCDDRGQIRRIADERLSGLLIEDFLMQVRAGRRGKQRGSEHGKHYLFHKAVN